MTTVLDKKLLIVAGKGGAGKTTIATAVALLAAREGKNAIVVEVGAIGRVPTLFGVRAREPGVETALAEGVSSITIDPDRALLEWLQELGGRVPGRVLASSGTFQYFAAAAPGVKELVSMIKVWELTRSRRWKRHGAHYDLVVLDAPATGHALAMLSSPRTFGAIARVGAVAAQTRHVEQLLADDERSGYIAVATATELAIEEALELEQRLADTLARELDAVLVNAVIPQRFSASDLQTLERAASDGELGTAAFEASSAVHERARAQHSLVARLRRRGLPVHTVPFQFVRELDRAGVERIASSLARKI
jgi:anion-transporting  ArsA/GET3 family ATPase